MPTPEGLPGDHPAATDGGDSDDTGRTIRGPRWSRLETDDDVTRLLQEHYPRVDDPAARAAIVAQFARRHDLRAAHRRRRASQVVGVVGLFLLLIAVGWSVVGSRRGQVARRPPA
ncbi:MAG: hypothetical protein ACRDJW_18135 [Thermomicrobiales bacterium]